MKSLCALWISIACVVLNASALAQGYPSKAIRVISPSGAGGPVDVICRAMSQSLSTVLGQQLVVENREGDHSDRDQAPLRPKRSLLDARRERHHA